MPKLVMEGTLRPRDGVQGCTFTVHQLDFEENLQVTLRSPYRDKEIVDQATVNWSEFGEWLGSRIDY